MEVYVPVCLLYESNEVFLRASFDPSTANAALHQIAYATNLPQSFLLSVAKMGGSITRRHNYSNRAD